MKAKEAEAGALPDRKLHNTRTCDGLKMAEQAALCISRVTAPQPCCMLLLSVVADEKLAPHANGEKLE